MRKSISIPSEQLTLLDDTRPTRVADGTPRPLVKWAGGKRALLGQILKLAPREFRRYVEPFIGGASYFLALRPAIATIGDANEHLIELYTVARDQPSELMAALDALQPKVGQSTEYYRIREQDQNTLEPVARAARFIFLNKTGYNGLYRVNRMGKFNVPFGTRATPPQLYDRENLLAVSRALTAASIRHEDFEVLLDELGDGDFAYVDPPYVPTTTTSNFTRYTANDFGRDEQERLAEAIGRAAHRGATILTSNSDTPLVRELYCGHELHEISAPRRINSRPTARGAVTELAILVPPQGSR